MSTPVPNPVLRTPKGLSGPPIPGAILAKIQTEGGNFGRYYYYAYSPNLDYVFLGYADPSTIPQSVKTEFKEHFES